MMFQEPVGRQMHRLVLIAAFIVLLQELSSGGGAQAWTYNSDTTSRRWLEARAWCQENNGDLVPIRNQEESDFINNLIPYNTRYYWIGIHKNPAQEWIWAETGEPLPKEALNWAPGEPDDILSQDCVEIYIKRDKDTAMWNNENCRKKKGAICYRASCTQDACSANADCVETVGNYSCRCHPGFLGPRCEEAIACKPLLDPERGSHHCFQPHGSNRFNSSCRFHCELGFQLVGAPRLLCQASGLWDHPAPLCQVEQCPLLNHTISAGRMSCSHPVASYSYNSTCEVRCDEGHEPSGPDRIRCDHGGRWTASVPACAVKKCSPIFFPVTGNVTCVDALAPFSFGSRCDFTCQEGYHLTGGDSVTCLASGQWSGPAPTCTVVQCDSLEAPAHSSMPPCQDPLGEHSYGSVCTVQCAEGFDLIGSNVTECSSQGNWTHALPVCEAKRCHSINPPHGSPSCSGPNGAFRFGSLCTTTCDEGFLLNGTASTECNSLGTWSAEIPRCLAKRCPALNASSHASSVCSDPHEEFSFGSRCTSACEEGFLLIGTADTECTSSGTWSADIPHCLAKRCPTLSSPSHGSLSCPDPPHGEFSFGCRCTSACEEGFLLNGTADTECTSSGMWSADVPRCLAKRCPTLSSPSHGSSVCSDPHEEFSFGSRCTSACEEGFLLIGEADTECTSSGMWSADVPHCLAKRCPTLSSPSHGSLSCPDPPHGEFSFGSRCTSACEEGFLLNGEADTECTSSGTWSADVPHCLAQSCPLVVKPPPHGRMNCSHPHSPFSYGSRCAFQCNEGFRLRGTPTSTCNHSGLWSGDLPACRPVQCEAIRASASSLSVNCSRPLGNFSFGSRCRFSCEEGLSLNGSKVLTCSSTGRWNDSMPTCLDGLPVRSAMLLSTGVGAASVVVPLVLIGLALLILKLYKKKKEEPIINSAQSWGDLENPAFDVTS